LRTAKPVISNHRENEQRFRTPELLAEHGVRRAMNVSERLNEAASRVNAVGRAYERLAYTADYEKIDLIEYLRQIVRDLEPTVAPNNIQFEASGAIQFAADRAILVGLIITELVSNAGKYAYPDRPGGSIWVPAQRQPDKQAILISVRDEGRGLPHDFDPATSKRLGRGHLVTGAAPG
jgi:two-component sensor histidine kinase